MSAFKCKMCGGALTIEENQTVVTCEYCGTQQTLPKLDDERRANMYDRANHFRRNNEFDKAMSIYENILNEDNTDAEAYWSIVLCRYGIEYVEDPSSHKRIPTINRAQFTSIFDDEDYKSALEYADIFQRSIYEEEAKAINEIQKGILAISQREEPFDVFICYKETDNNGRRTPDSVLAQELYYQLKNEGFKVFFSRITLEDKLGSAYEPYIFAALNSAKVMVVLGTKQEHFNAVWVKNEWSRYLALTKNGAKKTLIPAYRDMDPYDLPEEFSHLQAQDMSKLGFMQDLIRGIKKIATISTSTAPAVSSSNPSLDSLVERIFMFLEDGDFASADKYCEKVLDIDPKCAKAYVGKLMVQFKKKTMDQIAEINVPIEDNNYYKRIISFGDQKLKEAFERYVLHIKNNVELLNAQRDLEKQRRAVEEERKRKEKAEADERKRIEDEARAERTKIEARFNIIEGEDGCTISKCIVRGIAEEIEIPSHYKGIPIKHIGESVFWMSDKLRSVTIPDTVTSIGKRAFANCENLESVTISSSLTSIGEYAFYQCPKLTGIKLPDTVTSIGSSAFSGCTGLKEINIPNSLTSIGGVFPGCTSLTSITIPNSVTHIGDSAFTGCKSLTNITIPNTVGEIGGFAFYECTGLKSITLPNFLTKINQSTFYGCMWLRSIVIPDSVTSISGGAFINCTSLKEITIPASVRYIADGAFSGCQPLEIEYKGTTKQWNVLVSNNRKAFEGCLYRSSVHCSDTEKIEAEHKAAEEQQLKKHRREHNSCQHCGGQFKGFFTKKCADCGREKDY